KVESKTVVPNTTSTVKEPTVSNNNKPANEKKVVSNGESLQQNSNAPRITTNKPGKENRLSEAANGDRTRNKKAKKNNVIEEVSIVALPEGKDKRKDQVSDKKNEIDEKVEKPQTELDEEKPDPETLTANDKTDEAAKPDQVAEAKAQSPIARENSRWTLGAVYAPDISTVKFTHTQPAGFNIGMMVEYRLSKKFSLQTGLIY